MEYLIYISIILFSVTQTSCIKFYNRNSDNAIAYNVIKALSALLFFAILCITGLKFHAETTLFGCLYGVSLTISMFFGYKAISTGPLSLTGMIIAFSVVIPIIYGLGFCGEKLTIFGGIGFFFLVAAIIFTNLKKDERNTKTNYAKWLIYVLLTFLTDGICAVLQKVHQIRNPGAYSREFMLFAMLTCSLFFLIIGLIKTPPKVYRTIKGKWLAALAGVTNAAANFFTIVLAGYENASVLFPTISVGTILGALLCGALIFKEKLRINHYAALAFGAIAIVFLNI